MIHVYYGDGQGKTSAAAGLALRAVAAGWRVCFVQFLKDGMSGEVCMLRQLPNATVLADGALAKFTNAMTPDERAASRSLHNANLRAALDLVDDALEEGVPALLVLDEALDACAAGLLDETLLSEALARGKASLELAVTGHMPLACVLKAADYVTKLDCVRHPYAFGAAAREGVEF